MTKLPLNAHAFFTSNKPKAYVYHAQDVQEGLITGREIQVINPVNTMENRPAAHLMPPHLQTKVQTPQRGSIITLKQSPVRSTYPQQIAPLQKRHTTAPRVTQPPQQRCKHMKVAYNSGCGCSSLMCQNPECDLSKKLPSGGQIKLHTNNCRPENCRYFEL